MHRHCREGDKRHGHHKHGHGHKGLKRKRFHEHGHKHKLGHAMHRRHHADAIEAGPPQLSDSSRAVLNERRRLLSPEGVPFRAIVRVDTDMCEACGKCAKSCPVGAIHVHRSAATIDESVCNSCGACIDACPTGALSLIGT